jgi:hypothetical protein
MPLSLKLARNPSDTVYHFSFAAFLKDLLKSFKALVLTSAALVALAMAS